MTEGALFLADDHLVMDFPYNAERVAAIKTVNGAKWDKVARVWRVPVASIDEVREIAEKWGFMVDGAEVRLANTTKQC